MTLLLAWLLSAMAIWSPPIAKDTAAPARYESIARDVIAVTYDPTEAPLFAGSHGRARTALLVLAVASMESGYRADVDDGRVKGKLGEVCVLQVLLPRASARIVMTGDTYSYSETEGWSYADLVSDRQKCVRAALRKMRESFRACKSLSLYTSGKCSDEPMAKHRQGRAEGWWRHAPAPVDDADVMTVALVD